jgi:muramoyltetrapeptide carboxypeptidase
VKRRAFHAAALALCAAPFARNACGQVPRRMVKPPRLNPGDTVALIAPSSAVFHRQAFELAHESLQALGFKVREAPHLRARRGHLAGTDAQRAADVNAMFADPQVHALWALGGGAGSARILPLLDEALVARHPKVVCGYSDTTALLNGLNARTGLVTFHAPFPGSEWNEFDQRHLRAAVMQAESLLLRNPQEKGDALVQREGRTRTLRPGRARGPLVGGNLAVLAGLAGSPYLPSFQGAILFLEDTNEYLYRVDRMLSTLANAGLLKQLAGVVMGACTQCTPGEGHGSLTLEEILDDHFLPLNVPVYSGAFIGHIRRKFTLPIGLPVEMDADAGTLRFLEPAVA